MQPPYYTPSSSTPPKKKRRVWPWIVGGVGALLICSCIGLAYIGSHINNSTDTTASSSVQDTPASSKHIVITQYTATTTHPTATTGGSVMSFTATHGNPHIGGNLSDFIGKYGIPSDTTRQPYNFTIGSGDQAILIGVRTQVRKVVQVIIVGPQTWSKQTTHAYCSNFMPGDAQKIGGDISFSELYKSAEGEFSFMVNDSGSCVLNIPQS